MGLISGMGLWPVPYPELTDLHLVADQMGTKSGMGVCSVQGMDPPADPVGPGSGIRVWSVLGLDLLAVPMGSRSSMGV